MGRRLAAPDRAPDLVDLADERERVAGRDDPLEAAVVDACEERDPPRFSSSTSTATAPVWAMASTIRTPGITGRSGKCPANHQPSSGTR